MSSPNYGMTKAAQVPNLSMVALDRFLSMQLPARPQLLSPWLPAQGLAMIHAPRGIGKTFLGLSIALTVSSGGSLFGWNSQERTSVVYIDGEMPAFVLQQRLASLLKGQRGAGDLAGFNLMNPELNCDFRMPDLSTLEGQALIENSLPEDAGLIIIDNLSSLVSGNENESDVWKPVQNWLLRMRSSGRSVLLVHHSGKKGLQRGTSRREDVLDTVISLRRPKRYNPADGARFEVHFEKSRGFFGRDAAPFVANLIRDGNQCLTWEKSSLTNRKDKVIRMMADGLSQSEMARKLGVDRSTICRDVAAIKRDS